VERGVPEDVALRGTRIRAEQLLNPDLEVSAKQELRVIANLLDALDDPAGLGLEAGARYHLTAYGIYGFALISSPSLRSAIEVGLRYLDLTFAFSRMRAREEDGQMQMVIDAPDAPVRLRRFLVERDAAAVQTIQRELFGAAIPLHRVSFACPAPDSVDRYAEILGVIPDFDAEETVLGFDPTLLDVPLPQANPHTAVLAQAQCRDLLARQEARTGLAGEVRDLILASPSRPPDADQVAARLHLSPRTLRHRLAAEGTSFRALLEEVRERLAEELLLGGLTVSEVSERLGYVELSSFSQAFRRWKGVGPREYRASQPARARVRI
jgi:AraC-like DNA-binding protein